MGQRQREQIQRGCAVGTMVLLAWLCRAQAWCCLQRDIGWSASARPCSTSPSTEPQPPKAPGKRPADSLGHASHSFVIPQKVAPPESPANRYPLRQRARTPLPRPGGSRKPAGAFFVGRTARSGRKKQGCSTSLWGSPVWLRGVGARASGVSGRVRLSARFSFPPEPPGCFPGSARASARC